MWEKIKAIFKNKGIEIPADKENEFKSDIEKLTAELNGNNPDLAKILDGLKNTGGNEISPVLEALVKEIAVLSEQNKNLTTLLNEEKVSRQKAIQAQADADRAAKEKKVNDAIKKALADKKITEADKESWIKRLTSDFDEWNKELEAKPVLKQFEKKETIPKGRDKGVGDEKKSLLRTATEIIREQMQADTKEI